MIYSPSSKVMGTRGRLKERDRVIAEGKTARQPAKQKGRLSLLDDIRSLYFSSYFIKIHMHEICHTVLLE